MRSTPVSCVLLLALAAAPAAAELRVSAAASLADVLGDLVRLWESTGGEPVTVNLGASSTLARQIESGAPADVFVSADAAQMDRLAAADLLVPESRRDLVSNSLVTVVARDAPRAPAAASELAGPQVVRLALADPAAVPAGVYTRLWLEGLGLWASVEPRVIPLENVRAALAAVESGNADVGVVYATDAATSTRVRVAFRVAGEQAPTIVYPAAALRDARSASRARAFVDFLASPRALELFERHGFLPPPSPQ